MMWKRIKEFYEQYLAWINAYWLVTIAFLIVTLTVGDSSLYKRYTYDEKIRSLEKEIEHYQKEIEVNGKKLNDLHTDKDTFRCFCLPGFSWRCVASDAMGCCPLSVCHRLSGHRGQLSDHSGGQHGFPQQTFTSLQCDGWLLDGGGFRFSIQRT